MYRILLIDDEAWERDYIGYSCEKIFGNSYQLDYAAQGSKAILHLFERTYDLILLDNQLSESLTAKFSVPFIKEYSKTAKIVIISNNVQEEYLHDGSIPNVDYVVEKKRLELFLRHLKNQAVERVSI